MSILFIFIVHQLILFLKNTLTIPKFKDLVNAPMKKYDKIYKIISDSESNNNGTTSINDDEIITANINLDLEGTDINAINNDLMKHELKNFMKDQFNS
jgi:hypothetical protein